jgi:putative serine protease PepD
LPDFSFTMLRAAYILLWTGLLCLAQTTNRSPKGVLGQGSASPPTLTTVQIAKKVSPSVVTIEGRTDSGDVLGTGFIVSRDGKIVTNLHVVREMKSATVELANGEIYDSVSVLATDERKDLAIIQIPAGASGSA